MPEWATDAPLAPPPLEKGLEKGRSVDATEASAKVATNRVGIPSQRALIPTRLARLKAGLGDLPFSREGGEFAARSMR
jgi:hypothetical protein